MTDTVTPIRADAEHAERMIEELKNECREALRILRHARGATAEDAPSDLEMRVAATYAGLIFQHARTLRRLREEAKYGYPTGETLTEKPL